MYRKNLWLYYKKKCYVRFDTLMYVLSCWPTIKRHLEDVSSLLLTMFVSAALIKIKAELQQRGFFFALNFLPLDLLLKKKLEIEKTKTT